MFSMLGEVVHQGNNLSVRFHLLFTTLLLRRPSYEDRLTFHNLLFLRRMQRTRKTSGPIQLEIAPNVLTSILRE